MQPQSDTASALTLHPSLHWNQIVKLEAQYQRENIEEASRILARHLCFALTASSRPLSVNGAEAEVKVEVEVDLPLVPHLGITATHYEKALEGISKVHGHTFTFVDPLPEGAVDTSVRVRFKYGPAGMQEWLDL